MLDICSLVGVALCGTATLSVFVALFVVAALGDD
jgi:hypothetical protein